MLEVLNDHVSNELERGNQRLKGERAGLAKDNVRYLTDEIRNSFCREKEPAWLRAT